MITWWVQLVNTTILGHWEAVSDILVTFKAKPDYQCEIHWDGSILRHFSITGETEPLAVVTLLEDLRPYIGEYERMIFVRMVQAAVFDRAAVEYFVVTKNMTATLSGQALVQRAIYMSRIAEEDLEKAQKAFDGHPDPG